MKNKIVYVLMFIVILATILFVMPKNDANASDTDFEISMEAMLYDEESGENLPIENNMVNVGDYVDVFLYVTNTSSSQTRLSLSSFDAMITYDETVFQYEFAGIETSGWKDAFTSSSNVTPGEFQFIGYNNNSRITYVNYDATLCIGFVEFVVLNNAVKETLISISTDANDILANADADRIYNSEIVNDISLDVAYNTTAASYFSVLSNSKFYYSNSNTSFDADVYYTNNTEESITFDGLDLEFNISSDDSENNLKYVTIGSITEESLFSTGSFSSISNVVSRITYNISDISFSLAAGEKIKLFTISLDVTSLYQGDTYLSIIGNGYSGTNQYVTEEFKTTVSIINTALDGLSSDNSLKTFTYSMVGAVEATNVTGWSSTDEDGTIYELPDLAGSSYSTLQLTATPNDEGASVEVSTNAGTDCTYQAGGYWYVELNDGDNTINIIITAADGSERIYMIEVYIQSSEIGDVSFYFDGNEATLSEIFTDVYSTTLATNKYDFELGIKAFAEGVEKKITYIVEYNGVLVDDLSCLEFSSDSSSLSLYVEVSSEDGSKTQVFDIMVSIQSSDTSLVMLGYEYEANDSKVDRLLFNDNHNENLIQITNGSRKTLFTFDVTVTESGTVEFGLKTGTLSKFALADNFVDKTTYGVNTLNIIYSNGSIAATPTDIDNSKEYFYYFDVVSYNENVATISVSIINLSSDTAYISKIHLGVTASSGITLSNYSNTDSEITSLNYTFGDNGISNNYLLYKADVITTGYTPSNGIRTYNPMETGLSKIYLYAQTTNKAATFKVYYNNASGKEVTISNGYYELDVNEGANVYYILVTAAGKDYDGNSITGSYTINLHSRYTTAELESVTVNNTSVSLSEETEDGYAGIYKIDVENDISTVKITATGKQAATASITGSTTRIIEELETLEIIISVTSESNTNYNLYKLYIYRKGNDDSSISSINVTSEAGTIIWNTVFDSATIEYDITISNDAGLVDIELIANKEKSIISYNDENGTGSFSLNDLSISSINGSTNYYTYSFVVTSSSSESTTTYTLNIHKKEDTSLSSVSYNNGNRVQLDSTKDYAITVLSDVTYIDLVASATSSNVVVTIYDDENNVNNYVDIEIGTPRQFKVNVKSNVSSLKFAADEADYTFTFTVKGDSTATLDYLGVNSQTDNLLAEGTLEYTYELSTGIDSAVIYFTRTSEKASVYLLKDTSSEDVTNITSKIVSGLAVGDNEFTIRVVAEDGSTIVEYSLNLYVKGNINLDIILLTANDGKYVATLLGSGSYRFNVLSSETTLKLDAVLYNSQAEYEASDINLLVTNTGSIKVYVKSYSRTYTINVVTYSSVDENHLKALNYTNTDDETDGYTTTIGLSHYANDGVYRYAVYTFVPYSVNSLSYSAINATLTDGWSFTDGTISLGTQTSISKVQQTLAITNGVDTQYYTLIVIREAASSDASISSLTMKGNDNKTYTPIYDSISGYYTLNVQNSTSSITLSEYVIADGAILTDSTNSLSLVNPGVSYEYIFKVTAEDGTVNNTKVLVTRLYDDNVDLASLFVSEYVYNGTTISNNDDTIVLSYVSGKTEYEVSVEYAITSVTIVATLPTTSTASINPVNGTITKELVEGNTNVVSFTVTSRNNVSQIYTITITRLSRSSSKELKEIKLTDKNNETVVAGYDTTNVSYYGTYEYEHEYIYVAVSSHTGVSYYVKNYSLENGKYKVDLTAPTSSSNAVTRVEIIIVAEDESEFSYYLDLYRKPDSVATISSFELSEAPVSLTNDVSGEEIIGVGLVYSINPNQMHYSVIMPNKVTKFDLTAYATSANATVTVTAPTGNLSTTTVFTYVVKCTAQNGSYYTYYVDAIREKSSEVSVSDILYVTRNTGGTRATLTKDTNGVWNLEVDYNVSAITRIEFDDAISTRSKMVLRYDEENIEALKNALYFTGTFNLNIPNSSQKTVTTFYIDVYAEDGITFETYELNVYRKSDTTTDISGFILSEGSVDFSSTKNKYYYTVTEWDRTEEFSVEVVMPDNTTASVTPKISKLLSLGKAVEYAFTVTAQDGITTADYYVYVTIYAEADAHLDNVYIADDSGTTKYEVTGDTISHKVTRFNDYVKLEVNGEDYSQYVSSITWSSGSLTNRKLNEKIYVDLPTRDAAGNGVKVVTKVILTVIAEDTVTRKNISIELYRDFDTENNLTSLEFNENSYTANGVHYNTFVDEDGNKVTFNSSITDYKVYIFTSQTSVSITAKINSESTALISENLKQQYDTIVDIEEDETLFSVNVLSEAGTLKTYTINIVKKTNTQSELESLTTTTDNSTYTPVNKKITLEVPYSTNVIGFTYAISHEAKLKAYKNQNKTEELDLLAISLEAPTNKNTSVTTFYIEVTSEDNSNSNLYTIEITRLQDTDKTISSYIFNPSYITINEKFETNTSINDTVYVYTATVINDISSLGIELFASNSNVRISTSSNGLDNISSLEYDLVVGEDKEFIFYVYSMSGSMDTYIFRITRLDDLPIVLKGFDISDNQSLNQTFTRGNQNYSIDVANNISVLTITALTEEGYSIIITEGKTQTKSLSTSTPTVFTFTVNYASASLTYNIIVTRAKSTVATTSTINLLTNLGETRVLTVQNDNEFVSYLPYGTTSVQLSPILDSNMSTTNIEESYSLELPTSSSRTEKVINFTITAENTTYYKEYIVTIYVEPDTNTKLDGFEAIYYDTNGNKVETVLYDGSNNLNKSVSNDIGKVRIIPLLNNTLTQTINASYLEYEIAPGNAQEYAFTVTAQNGNQAYYRILIKREYDTAKELLSIKYIFTYNGQEISQIPYENDGLYYYSVPYEVDFVRVDYEISKTAQSTSSSNYQLQLPTTEDNYVYDGEILVTAQDGSTASYPFRITRLQDDDYSIDKIITYIDGFENPTKVTETTYELKVDYEVSEITAEVLLAENSTARVLNSVENEELLVGENVFEFIVSAQNGNEARYQLKVTRAKNTVGKFERLFFISDSTRYELSFVNGKWSLEVPYSVASGILSMSYDGIDYISEEATLVTEFTTFTLTSPTVLGKGITEQVVTIESQDGMYHNYEVVIYRNQDNAAIIDSIEFDCYKNAESTDLSYVMTPLTFKPSVSNYSIEILHNDEGAYITLSASLLGTNTASFTAETQAVINDIIRFEDGRKTYSFAVTSQDGSVTTTYTFSISMSSNSANELFGVSLDDGTEFTKNANTGEYELDVLYEVETVNLELSYSPGATLLTTDLSNLALTKPTSTTNATTIFTFEIEAQDGTLATYKAIITRMQDENNYLNNIIVDGYEIDPVFDKNIQSYHLTVDQDVTTLNVEAILSNTETQKLEIVSMPDEIVSTADNEYRYKVIAQNGDERIYVLTVYKELSTEVVVNSIKGLIGNTQVDLVETGLGSYITTVPYSVTDMSFVLEVGKNCSYEAEASYSLKTPTYAADSITKIVITVYAEDGVTSKDYTINITRQRDTTNGLANLYLAYDEQLNQDQKFNEALKPDEAAKYTAKTPYSKTSVYVVAVPKASTQSISYRIKGSTESSTDEYIIVDLGYGETKIVEVYATAQNGAVIISEIEISRDEPDTNANVLSLSIFGSVTKTNYIRSLVHSRGTGFSSSIYEYDLIIDGKDNAIVVNGTASKLASSISGLTTYRTFPTTVEIKVVAEDGITIKTYKINVSKYSDDTSLSNLEVEGFDIGFESETLEYDLVVYQNEATEIKLNAIKNNDKQSVEGLGTHSLVPGQNTFEVTVTAENGDIRTYIINVEYVTASGNTYLSSLSVEGYDFIFNKFTLEYEITTNGDAKSITIFATPESAYSLVNGTGEVQLEQGVNLFDIIVTAQNGATKTYTIKVHWNEMYNDYLESLSITGFEDQIEFDPYIAKYKIRVIGDYSTITINAKAQSPLARVSGTGEVYLTNSTNTFIIRVKAYKNFERQYEIEVEYIPESKDAYLSYLEVEGYEYTPLFDKDVFEYSFEIIGDVEYINILAETSSTLSTIITGLGQNSIYDGENTIPVTVRAFEGNEQVYYVKVNLISSISNNYLDDLTIKEADIEFNPFTYEYFITVPQDTLTIDIDAIAASTMSTIAGIGTLDVNTGENTYNIICTNSLGEDLIYKVLVYRPESNNALLDWVSIKDVEFEFNSLINEYKVIVPETVTSTEIDATCESTLAVVNGLGTKQLNYGNNEFVLTVEAEDGTLNYYYINVYRTLCSNNYLASLKLWVNDKPVEISFDKETLIYEITISGNEIIVEAECEHETAKKEIEIPEKISSKSTIVIKVTAQDGSIREYQIFIIRTDFGWLMYTAIGIAALIMSVQVAYVVLRKKYFTE